MQADLSLLDRIRNLMKRINESTLAIQGNNINVVQWYTTVTNGIMQGVGRQYLDHHKHEEERMKKFASGSSEQEVRMLTHENGIGQTIMNVIRKVNGPILVGMIVLAVSASAAYAAEKTPIGAEKAGNKDGTIPAWTGDSKPASGWSPGKVRYNYWQHKDEKPLFVIDASNVDKYAKNLTPGQIQMLKTVKGYTMPVYPSHRECNYPDFVVSNTKQNAAGKSKIGSNGWSVDTAALPGVPFPNPKSGVEAVWNHLLWYQGAGIDQFALTTVSAAPGSNKDIRIKWEQLYFFPHGVKGTHGPKDRGSAVQYLFYAFESPAALAGQAIVQRYLFDQDTESFYYFPGQRRVRRLPTYAYDAPLIGFENQYPSDMQTLYFGNPDRFDWKIVGQKELYIPYNNLMVTDFTFPINKALLPKFVSPEVRRYELHRVLEVVGTVKKGVRHLAAKKTLYLDEDTWIASVGDDYDANGKLWKVKESPIYPVWELGGTCSNMSQQNFYDLISGRYVSDLVQYGAGKDYKYFKEISDSRLKPEFFTAETLRANSER